MSSPLADTMKRTSDMLRLGASKQVLEYERRFSTLRRLYEDSISDFIIMNFNCKEALETANGFFGASSVGFAGVDGTMYCRPLYDFVIFFGGAYASTGTVCFQDDYEPVVKYDRRTLRKNVGISSVAPIFINEIPNVDQAFFEPEQPEEVKSDKPLRDEAIIDNATIANWIMTFAEYYLAYKLATDHQHNTKIILLDRSLSTDRASILYDTSKRTLWKAKSSIIGLEIDGEYIDENDLMIARQYVYNQALGLPPPRGDYLQYAIVHLLRRNRKLAEEQILSAFEIIDEKRAQRLRRYLKRLVNTDILLEEKGVYALRDKYAETWTRTQKLVTRLGDRFFFTQEPETDNIMKILRDGKETWITTLDIAFLTLFTVQMLMEECWKRRILLLGITKDTSARDFKRQLIPIMQNEGLLKTAISPKDFEKLPNTDRMILQSVSILNPQKVKPPWSLIEYDSAFKTLVPDKQNRRSHVSGAIKNKTSLEKTFLKTYTQLSQAKSDPMLRSNVLLVDRLVYPEYDYRPENIVEFWNEFNGAKEPVETILFIDNNVPNKIQNLTMTILAAMAPPSIPEAFGHNKPLFIADKIAKWNYRQFKRIVDTTADWMLNNHKLRRFIFYMGTFRERRATIEAARRENI